MHARLLVRTICAGLLFCGATLFASGRCSANNQGGANVNNNFAPPIAGIEIDAQGVLRTRSVDPMLTAKRMAAAANRLDPKLAGPSKLRKISLNRLESAIRAKQVGGHPIPDEMQAVAGLTSVEYVFFYPDSGDIVLAGSAEGFAEDAAGCVRGIFSGRPTVLLEDLLVALRAYAPGARPTDVISVSIDPTPEGLSRMQKFLKSIQGQASRANTSSTNRIAQGMKDNLGLQTVKLSGIPEETHFAQVLVEADYRMKLIGIGLERLNQYRGALTHFKSYVERATPGLVSSNSMERWYFLPSYDCVHVSEDSLAMQLKGNGVKLVGANELVGDNGLRAASARVNGASQVFCQDFTNSYEEISKHIAVYAQLRNLIDLSIAAAFIQQQDYCGQINWDMGLLLSEDDLPVRTRNAPHQVETAVNAIWRGNTLMTPLGGGINMQPRLALRRDTIAKDDGTATAERAAQNLQSLADGQWWWD